MTTIAVEPAAGPPLTRKDFVADEEVRWCPGCSSRLPYYMNTYGFHSIHGRAPAIASGLKLTRPELSVWVITGDGDALSIGGNHILHVMRRNVDLQIVLHNNEIYGLTKGQYSPTTHFGQVTKSSPVGVIDWPLRPLAVALGAEASFVGRTLDADPHHMQSMLMRAHEHRGTSFLEVYQNCNIFNDGIFDEFAAKEVRADRMLFLEHGQPMIFGKERNKGIRLTGLKPEVVEIGKDGVTEADILVHDETREDPTIAFMLTRMDWPEYPVPVGVIRAVKRPIYGELLAQQIEQAIETQGPGDIAALMRSGETWVVE